MDEKDIEKKLKVHHEALEDLSKSLDYLDKRTVLNKKSIEQLGDQVDRIVEVLEDFKHKWLNQNKK